eukprot:CAMPEP_0194035860 /NCGR_PEP_ID=MMETSP0009_2-20130614/8276_1 /TAXON_ID=210454 /ORGANISM="Grammatophora oceanica, Strain CCMP 410" /LENGTH=880 /DNA_ID=CAMNT_0038677401 /DNA_START=21 /DNA_END=2663 /DNA_ORIENTATION=+
MNSSPPHRRRNGPPNPYDNPSSDSWKARIFLIAACVWPLIILIFFTATPNAHVNDGVDGEKQVVHPGLNLRKMLDRVDVMGYGPTHPRVAVVVVGEDAPNVEKSVKSVFGNIDMARLFMISVVMDGVESDPGLEARLAEMNAGSVPHWHGLTKDKHSNGDGGDDPHGQNVNVVFNKNKQGIAASRSDAVDFISMLSKRHEMKGIKSPEEDLILLFLKSGVELEDRSWLGAITSALIVPPPILGVGESDLAEDQTVAMKLANAVSFGMAGAKSDMAASFDYTFTYKEETPNSRYMAMSNGESYPSPVLSGEAMGMRLQTFVGLPSHDPEMFSEWEANLDLSLNLWLCADGIDMLTDAIVKASETRIEAPRLSALQAARFAAAWMSETDSDKVYEAWRKQDRQMTTTVWHKFLSDARLKPTYTPGLQNRCRSFTWYAHEINMSLDGREVDEEAAKQPYTDENPDVSIQRKLQDEAVKAGGDEGNKLPGEAPGISVEKADDSDNAPPPRSDPKMPHKPLDSTRAELVGRAQPIDITFEDVSGGHKDHPHLGAKDESGNLGYIHDETALRENPPAYEFDNLENACNNHDSHYKMLTEKVKVKAPQNPKSKIFCLVYTIDSGHKNIPPIRETWGQRCDGFMVGSNMTDASIGAVNIVHEGPEEYNNIWQKVRSMWAYIYDNYYEKYDWFHIGGDDLYMIVDNLRSYVDSEEIQVAQNGGMYLPTGDEKDQTPLFLGRRFAYGGNMDDIFNSGGSGYTMNKAALKTLVVKGMPGMFPHAHTFSEDTMVARILRKFGVFPYDTKDEDGGERYMPFMPGHHLGYRPPPACVPDPLAKDCKDWYPKYSIDIKYGMDHCAEQSVAFHYVKDNSMKRLHALLYNKCPSAPQ